jgi:hypothetical protein
MSTKMKWIYLFTLMISFAFQSCEKDLNEEPQVKEQAKEGVINHVTINDVPFLKPNVESFQSNLVTGKSFENGESKTELDLQHIIEYDGIDDFKSYTIPVIGAGVENEDYYFENLHILKDEDKYESFVARYFPYDKTKKFELNHFTGKMEFFDENKILKNTLYFENGEVKKAEIATTDNTTGKTNVLPDRAEDDDCKCGPTGGGSSLLSQFFSWISGLFSNIHISFGSGGYYSGDGSYTGDYYLSIASPSGGGGSYPGDGNSNSGGNGSPTVVFVPSQAQGEYQRMQVVDIVRKLGTIDATAFLWMMDYRNADDVNNVYYVLNEVEDNTPETLDFLRKAIITRKASGEVDYWFKIIIDKSFRENECLYGMYLKLGQASTFNKYLQKFDGNFSVANLQFGAGVDPNHSTANAVTYSPINYLIEIKFNPNNLKRPGLDIARTFIHELIHAEIYRKLLSCSRLPHVNVGKMSDSQWQIYINNLKNNFPTLFDYYMRYLYNVPANQQVSDPQHELMAQHYRQIVVQVLKQYDGNAHSDEFYNALAWIGLMGEGEFPIDSPTGLPPVPSVAWKNVPQSQRLQILSIYKDFLNTNVSCQ